MRKSSRVESQRALHFQRRQSLGIKPMLHSGKARVNRDEQRKSSLNKMKQQIRQSTLTEQDLMGADERHIEFMRSKGYIG